MESTQSQDADVLPQEKTPQVKDPNLLRIADRIQSTYETKKEKAEEILTYH